MHFLYFCYFLVYIFFRKREKDSKLQVYIRMCILYLEIFFIFFLQIPYSWLLFLIYIFQWMTVHSKKTRLNFEFYLWNSTRIKAVPHTKTLLRSMKIMWEVARASVIIPCTPFVCNSLTSRDTCLHSTMYYVTEQIFASQNDRRGQARFFRIFTSRDTRER